MFKFRILLLFVGVFLLGGSDSYTSTPAYPTHESYGSYGYSGYAPSYPSYSPPAYGGYSPPSYGGYKGSSYTNCAYMKVIEVLDQIFCSHADKKRYSSTIYPYIYQIIDQLEWTSEMLFIPDCWDYVSAAIHELKTLQDAVYSLYGESSLLQPYEEYDYSGCEDCTQGTQGAGTKSTTRTNAAKTMKSHESKLQSFENDAKTFKTASGVNFKQSKVQGSTSGVQETKSVTKTFEVQVEETEGVNQRSSPVQVLTAEALNDKLLEVTSGGSKRSPNSESLLSKARASRDASLKSRKARGYEYSDYTCSYLSEAYCYEDKYDELLYNILIRLFVALDFLNSALFETWTFMEEIDSGESYDDQEAYQEAAITFGAILTSYYSLLEIAEDVERMYEIMELDYGEESGSYYRSGGGSDNVYVPPLPASTSTYTPAPSKPVVSPYLNKAPGVPSYPYGGYVSQPPATLSYSGQNRYQRAAVTPAIPHQIFLVG